TTLQRLPEELKHCEDCGNYTEERLCYFCRHPGRQVSTICVVKDPFAIERMERTQAYKGRYHVLHGVIDILNGVTPDRLNLSSLIQRIEKGLQGAGPKIDELIIALDSDLEGEATTLYLQEVLQVFPVRVTRLARGVPMGSNMGYLDERTLSAALQNRVEISAKTGSHS
ncbi:MAG: recombination mediator RecR, partial [Bdellovibrionaceae bacterium]|nr:recombination mediator RecR [Pseudobdellovibrionaceae bacterium]